MDRLGDLSQFDGLREGAIKAHARDAESSPYLESSEIAAIYYIPELLAALKESRKEVEELRGNARRAKTILQEEIESIEQEDGGRGCVTAMIDAIVELEGKQ